MQVFLPILPGETERVRIDTTYLNTNLARQGWVRYKDRYVGTTLVQRVLRDGIFRDTGNGPFRALLTRQQRHNWEDGIKQTRTKRTWRDGYNREIKSVDYGYTGDLETENYDPSDDISITFGYISDRDRYIMDRPWGSHYYASSTPTPDRSKWLTYTRFFYDGMPLKKLDGIGNLTTVQEWGGSTYGNAVRTVSRLSYDQYGNLLSEADAAGALTVHEYGGPQNLFRTNSTNAVGQTLQTKWDTGCQQPSTVKDANDLLTTYNYDAFCRETMQVLPTGAFVETDYFDFGDPDAQRIRTNSTSATGKRIPSWSYFDGLGQVYRTMRLRGEQSDWADTIQTFTGYDLRGNIAWQSVPFLSANWAAHQRGDADKSVRYTYDGEDRLIQTTYPDGAYERIDYETVNLSKHGHEITHSLTRTKNADCFDGDTETICIEAATVTDARGRKVQSLHYDRLLTDVGDSQPRRVTSYAYDPLDRLTGITDPSGALWSYSYDTFGNRLVSEDPDLGRWTMEYDERNNLLRQRDAKGQQIAFEYDALNRVTRKTVTPAAGSTEVTTYQYDQARTGFYNTGALTKITGPHNTISYNYGKTGGVEKEQHRVDGRLYTINREFGPLGQLLRERLPYRPNSVSRKFMPMHSYDGGERPKGFGDLITDTAYNAWEQPTRMNLRGGRREEMTYDTRRGWLLKKSLRGADQSYTDSTTLVRAPSGRIMQQRTVNKSARLNYRYDYAGRLLSSDNFVDPDGQAGGWNNYDETFKYNVAGSLVNKSSIGDYVYNAANGAHPHAPRKVGTANLTYDANGNMLTGIHGKVMTYDGENRPLSVIKAGVRSCYTYSADGSRLMMTETIAANCDAEPGSKFPAGKRTLTFANVEVREFKSGNETIFTYPHPNIRFENGENPVFQHRDHLGSVRQLVKFSDFRRESIRTYRPFGKMREWSYVAREPDAVGWIGQRYDSGAGLQYLNARYYDPDLGQFLQPDWFEIQTPTVGTNRYAYSLNDPVNLNDPEGNCPICAGVAIAAALGFFASTDPANAPGEGDPVLPSEGVENAIRTVVPGADAVSTALEGGDPLDVAMSVLPGRLPKGSKSSKNSKASANSTSSRILSDVDPHDLVRTHPIGGSSSSKKVDALSTDMRSNGFQREQPVNVVKIDGKMYIVDGHHRAAAARRTNTKVDVRVLSENEMKQQSGFKSYEDVLQSAAQTFGDRLTPPNKYTRRK